jgi:hypothetical protein
MSSMALLKPSSLAYQPYDPCFASQGSRADTSRCRPASFLPLPDAATLASSGECPTYAALRAEDELPKMVHHVGLGHRLEAVACDGF